MANYIIYTDEIVNMRVSCIEADAQAMATANNAYLSLDTFDNYDLNQLEAVNGVIQVKSQAAQDAENVALLLESRRSERNSMFANTLDRMNVIWYNSLTSQQQQDLSAWRAEWLDYPSTGIRPDDLDIF
jgi:hypothetical protein